MDVRALLQAARAEAGFDQRRLAIAAGTARTTVVAYETGAQSPTVRQLDRLLAACGLRAAVVLEPMTSDVDRVLDEALAAGPPRALDTLSRFADSLSSAQVRWALDGRSAVAAQGLALPHHELPSGVLPLSLDDRVFPVLPLTEVRRAHGALAELLDRHEHRLAEQRGRRTV